MSASDLQLPVHGGAEKRAYVRAMFTAIAPTYDRLNRIISLSFDQRWRERAVRRLGWERTPDGTYLDLCAGTLDFAAVLARQPGFRGRVVGADFVPDMLRLGVAKAPRMVPVTADALELPFGDAVFDGVTVGWGMRNLVDLDAGLREIARVLRPGARLAILEMSQPAWQPYRAMYDLYFDHVLPAIGEAVSKHRNAYRWLPESTRVFPDPRALAQRMEQAGFHGVTFDRLLGGACALHLGARA
ncbi:MAG: ubiquinone/menaquinone biosynthesis methyltransferase [Gemmatimonadales bacterium]|jgi:demethylmenaquinone methyltransferase/2-methoxy-6-polyprenyl-1,4-benzoquinol methylase